MYANIAEAPVSGFASLSNTNKNIKKLKNKIPPIEAITNIIESGKSILTGTIAEHVNLTVIYNSKLKSRMAQASETMFKKLCDKAQNDIDRAKLNAYSHYAMFFIKAPVVIAVVNNTLCDPDLSSMIQQMKNSAEALSIELFDLCPQLSANKEFSRILELEKPTHVVTLFAVGYSE